uniref:Orf11 protein n=1 Tax=Enterococcus faecalis TaxID=1351 RepID=Q47794_ENTFL|nr:orf11 [Enterococcus faecalis] [Enterococcus faecalis OG1X]
MIYREKLNNYWMKKKYPVNEPLTKAVNALFSLEFDYDSSNKEQTVAKRKEKATVYATEQGSTGVFPRDSDKVVPSVVTVSQLDKAPEIFEPHKKIQEKKKQHWSARIFSSNRRKPSATWKFYL